MIRRKNWIKLFVVLFLSVFGSALLVFQSSFDVERIREMGRDFQYNVISTSAIIGGFLFTGISILISTIDKDRIKRLWNNNYLDNLYRSAFVGMISNVITIIAAFVILCLPMKEKVENNMFYIETTGLIVGLVFFLWCVKKLVSINGKCSRRQNFK